MSSSGSSGDVYAETLAVFDRRDDPSEPLTTPEVANSLDAVRRTVYKRLEKLASSGELKTKKVGANARVWWRSHPDEGSSVSTTNAHATPTLSNAERTVIEKILEASPISIVVVEPSGEIAFANQRAEETLELERDEITSRTYHQPEWKIYHDDGTPVSEDEHPVTRVLETKEPDYGFEHWIDLPSGTERWLSSNSAPVLSEDGDVEYIVVGFEDTTQLKEREDKLTSDKRRVLGLSSKQLFRPLLDVADGDMRIDVDKVVRLQDGSVLKYITGRGISAKELIDVFDQLYGVKNTRLLQSCAGECRVEVHVEAPTMSLVFAELGGQVKSLFQTNGAAGPLLTAEVPGDVEPRTAVQAAQKVYPDIRLESQELQYSPRLLYDIVEDVLTERQFTSLRTAYYAGYFEKPRKSTGDELAERLGITRQTFNQHLRLAEETVLEQLFDASGKAAR
ncbi:helix-turn-helix domain-containing protein [Halorientalis pallida]|uniref:PAS domain-containing protein n=1 Tax=Halorientalis pallida TaxID=2479928 RepID=A0A498KVK5_9EURY|nr:bacterio-opsin activator domain-containing protein [Halorientalis pallida]RXK47749.1 PAS domain-containing protein [Halorientalis pallida]